MTPNELLQLARKVLTGDQTPVGANRSLVAAILTRRALEATLDEFWRGHLPGIIACSSRSQLVTLPFYFPDQQLAAEAVYAWYALSESCHHSVSALPVPVSGVMHLIEITQRLDDAVETVQPIRGSSNARVVDNSG
jgi:hypothetical protein